MPEPSLQIESPGRERAWTSHLAFALYRRLAAHPAGFVFSPYSLLGALMVIRAGAGGATRREIEEVLDRRETGDALADAFGGLLRNVGDLARAGPCPLEIPTANALWFQGGWPVRPAFLQRLRALIGAEAGEVDFSGSPERAARTMNAWAAEVTCGQTPVLVDEEYACLLSHGILANVVCLAAPWEEPFDESATFPEPFHMPSGRHVDVPTLHRDGSCPHTRLAHADALQIPYASPRMRMIVVLPDEGRLRDVEQALGPGLLHEIIEGARLRPVDVALPRWRAGRALGLRASLEEIGVVSAFGPDADFSHVSDRDGLRLDDVRHRAFVAVGEQGTGDVKGPVPTAGSGSPRARGDVVEFWANRPFVFLVADVESETVFFMGRVTDPRGAPRLDS